MAPSIDFRPFVQSCFVAIKYKIFFQEAESANTIDRIVWPRMTQHPPGQSVVEILVLELPDVVAQAGLVHVSVVKAGPMLIETGLP